MVKKTDSELEQWVLYELGFQKQLRSREICVQSLDSVVTLSGSVPNFASKSAAAQAVSRVSGISAVVNNIRVKPCAALMRKSSATVAPPEPFVPSVLAPAMQIERQVAKAAMP